MQQARSFESNFEPLKLIRRFDSDSLDRLSKVGLKSLGALHKSHKTIACLINRHEKRTKLAPKGFGRLTLTRIAFRLGLGRVLARHDRDRFPVPTQLKAKLMPRTGTEVVKAVSVGENLRYAVKNTTDFFKARLETKNLKEGFITITPLDGPHFKKNGESAIKIRKEDFDSRIKGTQGRQPGFSPKKVEESPEPAKTTKPKSTGKKDKEETTEEFDLDSTKSEIKDAIEFLKDTVETANEKIASLEAIFAFLDNLQMGDSPEEEEESPKTSAKKSRRTKPMKDEDEEEAA